MPSDPLAGAMLYRTGKYGDSVAAVGNLDDVNGRVARAIRAHRQSRGLSLGALAAASDLSKTILGKIEAGQGNPSLETLWRIASALDVPLGALIEDDQPPTTRLIRRGEGSRVESDSGMTAHLILAEGASHRSEVFHSTLEKGIEYHSKPHVAGTEELVFCHDGQLEVGPEGREERLASGDALWFPADLPHLYKALKRSDVLIIMSYPPAQGVAR
jgi:transcriptional regulator with XRE-family HTH domain